MSNAGGTSHFIKILLIYICPISPDFNQKFSGKNASLILFNQLTVLHEENFKPIAVRNYVTEFL